jgi:hypothetical protein
LRHGSDAEIIAPAKANPRRDRPEARHRDSCLNQLTKGDFGGSFPVIRCDLSRFYLGNQANSAINSHELFHCRLLANLLALASIDMRLSQYGERQRRRFKSDAMVKKESGKRSSRGPVAMQNSSCARRSAVDR